MTPRRSIVTLTVVAAAAATVATVAGVSAGPGLDAQANQAVVMKGRAPVSADVLKIRLPRPAETDLVSGLHLMVLEDRRLPQVSFQLLIPGGGGFFDPANLAGLASVTATMMREGTTTLNTQQIAELLETKAATVNVSAGVSGTTATVSGSSLTENFDATFGLAADILLRPSFPQEELDRYKTRLRAQLLQQRTQPGFLANEMLSRVVYGAHPASRVSLTVEALDAITRAHLVDQHRRTFVPDHAVLAFAGDISLAEARRLVETRLGAWKKSAAAVAPIPDPAAAGAGKVHLVSRPNSVQTSILIGSQAIARNASDYDVLLVMNAVIGAGPTGRFFRHLREEKGYTYGAFSSLAALQHRGAWIANMDVRTDATDPALRDMLADIAQLRNVVVPDQELADRKRGIVASFALSLESPAAILNNHITRWLYKLPVDYWDTLPDRVMAVTTAAVQAAAKKYLDPSRLHIVAVGDAAKIGESLKQFGTVDVYDATGKPVGK